MPKPRKSGSEKPKKTLRILCEGAKTEPYYIKGYIQDSRSNNRADVVAVHDTRKNTPVQLVEEAIELKRSARYLPDDEFWVVYDRESVAKYSRAKHAEAWKKAQRAGVKVALSNVCFEFWILLHLLNTSAAYASCDDLLKNSPLKSEMKIRFGLEYEKASYKLYNFVREFIPDARVRAKGINNAGRMAANNAAMPFDINPFTDMCELLDAIDQFK